MRVVDSGTIFTVLFHRSNCTTPLLCSFGPATKINERRTRGPPPSLLSSSHLSRPGLSSVSSAYPQLIPSRHEFGLYNWR
ncbi:unnamed protein product [Protopolystoma xenopodis]|uniref:Uncharacterized protein n=1 Tax=Protopolystoma xenopodis TaxID=117903 RepID=A0A448WEY4_9PLAT|nr:unnamed protein product [Protopolystoma xenopodis]